MPVWNIKKKKKYQSSYNNSSWVTKLLIQRVRDRENLYSMVKLEEKLTEDKKYDRIDGVTYA